MPGKVTEDNYPEFKKSYDSAVKNSETQFKFEGQAVLTEYAKYIVQYVEGTI